MIWRRRSRAKITREAAKMRARLESWIETRAGR